MSESSSSMQNNSGIRIKRIVSSNTTSTQVLRPADSGGACVTTDDLNNENLTVEDETGKVYRVIHLPRSTISSCNTSGITVQSTTGIAQRSCAMISDVQPLIMNLREITHDEPPKPVEYQTQQGSYQLQAVDSETGQKYYIMLPSADTWESIQTAPSNLSPKHSALYPSTSTVDAGGGGASPSTSFTSASASSKRLKTNFGHVIINNSSSIANEGGYTSRKVIPSSSNTDATILNLDSLVSLSSSATNGNETDYLLTMRDGEIVTAPKQVKRRISHNEVEKKRRDNINMYISRLARLVPAAEEVTVKSSHSKGSVLSKTVDYIYELQDVNAHLLKSAAANSQPPNRTQDMLREEQICRLRDHVDQLTRENKTLRQKLAEYHSHVSRGRRGAHHQRAVSNRNAQRVCSPSRDQISAITPPSGKRQDSSSTGKSSLPGKSYSTSAVSFSDINISDEVPESGERD